MSFQLHANAPERSELHTFPGANHGVSYVQDPARYTLLTTEFSRRVLGDGKALLRL